MSVNSHSSQESTLIPDKSVHAIYPQRGWEYWSFGIESLEMKLSRLVGGAAILLTLFACGGGGASTNVASGKLVVVNASSSTLETFLDSVSAGTDSPDQSRTYSLEARTFTARYRFVGSSIDQLNESLVITPTVPQFRIFLNSATKSYRPFRGLAVNEALIAVFNGTGAAVDAYLVSSLATSVTPSFNDWKSLTSLAIGEVIVDKGSYRVLFTTPGSTTIVGTSDAINLGTAGGTAVVVFKGGTGAKVYTLL